MSHPIAVPTLSDTPRPNKRPRSSDANPGSSKAKHSPKYWFEDGNIILGVDDTLFRVHRGVLSRHSTVFRDMFDLPQPAASDAGGETVIEGCIVVDLPGDKSEDWENVFKVIYDFDTGYKKEGALPYKRLTSMLRLGRKYQLDVIFNEAFARIAAILPTKVERWDEDPSEFRTELSVPFWLISILLEIGNQSLLPSLYLYAAAVCSFSPSRIFAAGRKIPLHPDVIQTIIVGAEKVASASLEYHIGPSLNTYQFRLQREACRGSKDLACWDVRMELLRANLNGGCHILLVFYTAEKFAEMMSGILCVSCSKATGAAHEANRVAVWAQLPSYFGLPDWKDLKDL